MLHLSLSGVSPEKQEFIFLLVDVLHNTGGREWIWPGISIGTAEHDSNTKCTPCSTKANRSAPGSAFALS